MVVLKVTLKATKKLVSKREKTKLRNIRASEKYENILTSRYQKQFGLDTNTAKKFTQLLSTKSYTSITRKKQQVKTYRRVKSMSQEEVVTSLKRRLRANTEQGAKLRESIVAYQANNPGVKKPPLKNILSITFRDSGKGNDPLTKQEFLQMLKDKKAYSKAKASPAQYARLKKAKLKLRNARKKSLASISKIDKKIND